MRDAIVKEALEWVRTPYHHEARLKGVGVDCAQLLIGVYSNVGAVPVFDTGTYPMQWMLHREQEVFMMWVEDFARPLVDGEEPLPGDIVLYQFGRCLSHGGIVINWPTIVHAVRKVGQVLIEEGDQGDYAHPRKHVFYRLKQL